MTSNDNHQYLTVEMFNSKMDTFMTQIRLENEKLRSELRAEFQAGFSTLQIQTQVNSAKIEMLQHTFYWGFAILAVVVALVPYFRRERKQKAPEITQTSLTEDRVKELIAQALRTGKATM